MTRFCVALLVIAGSVLQLDKTDHKKTFYVPDGTKIQVTLPLSRELHWVQVRGSDEVQPTVLRYDYSKMTTTILIDTRDDSPTFNLLDETGKWVDGWYCVVRVVGSARSGRP